MHQGWQSEEFCYSIMCEHSTMSCLGYTFNLSHSDPDKRRLIEKWNTRATPPANAQLVEALKFIAGGCLVPPDGGSPTLQDAIEAAEKALAQKDANNA